MRTQVTYLAAMMLASFGVLAGCHASGATTGTIPAKAMSKTSPTVPVARASVSERAGDPVHGPARAPQRENINYDASNHGSLLSVEIMFVRRRMHGL